MTDKKKIEVLESAMFKLYEFSTSMNDNNLEAFETLKNEITNVLSENEKIRFNQIEFYEQVDFNEIIDDGLPF